MLSIISPAILLSSAVLVVYGRNSCFLIELMVWEIMVIKETSVL